MLARHGDIAEAGTWSTSSGSSGKPAYWPRGSLSLEQSIDLYDKIFRQSFQFHERSTLAVIGFAMGNWIGGTYTFTGIQHLRALGHRLSVIAPGIDVAAILSNIADLGPYYEQVVLVGYPPFVKDVLDQAPSSVVAMDLRILMAGENISEGWRDYILKRIGKETRADHTCLIYGTADAGIMGHETPTTITIRRLARNDHRLNSALFGGHEVQPTFVEYQPDFRFTETDPDGCLLFTIDNAFPLIRYRINDRGRLVTASELARLLGQCGHECTVRTSTKDAGLIALGHRTDIAATFYSLKIFPESVRAAFEDTAISGTVSGKFHLITQEDEAYGQTLRLRVELRADAAADEGLAPRLVELVVASLLRTNGEYRHLHQALGRRAEPVISLHHFGTGGFAHGIKQRWTGEPS
jgi:phenylacetate-CoA ligase